MFTVFLITVAAIIGVVAFCVGGLWLFAWLIATGDR